MLLIHKKRLCRRKVIDRKDILRKCCMDELGKYASALGLEELLALQPGESGITLSGGEKNKLALLRALCRDCKVLKQGEKNEMLPYIKAYFC